METPEAGGPTLAEENTVPCDVADAVEPVDDRVAWQTNLPDVDAEVGAPTGAATEPAPAEDPEETAPAESDVTDEVDGAEPPMGEMTDPAAEAMAAPEEILETEPEESPQVEEMVSPAPERRRSPVPWWPYLVYIVLWIGLAGGLAYVGIQAGPPLLIDSAAYPYLIVGGLLLTLLGPVLGVVGWLAARSRTERDERQGLFVAALLRAAWFTVCGVALFWGALVLVDALRLDWL